MRIEFHNGLRNPESREVTRVIILDKNGTPLVAAIEVDDGIILTETADKPAAFNAFLQGMGINHTVVVTDASQRSLPEIKIPG